MNIVELLNATVEQLADAFPLGLTCPEWARFDLTARRGVVVLRFFSHFDGHVFGREVMLRRNDRRWLQREVHGAIEHLRKRLEIAGANVPREEIVRPW